MGRMVITLALLLINHIVGTEKTESCSEFQFDFFQINFMVSNLHPKRSPRFSLIKIFLSEHWALGLRIWHQLIE